MLVTVMSYNPEWAADFARIRAMLCAALADDDSGDRGVSGGDQVLLRLPAHVAAIEHVGSTAVVGLAAKPIIDVDVVVRSREAVAPTVAALVARAGYTALGECGVEDRHRLGRRRRSLPDARANVDADTHAARSAGSRRDDDEATQLPPHNLYVVVAGSAALRNHLAVRDLCRADARVRDAYGAAKLALVADGRQFIDMDDYCEAKNDVVQWMLQLSGGLSADECEAIRLANLRVDPGAGAVEGGGGSGSGKT